MHLELVVDRSVVALRAEFMVLVDRQFNQEGDIQKGHELLSDLLRAMTITAASPADFEEYNKVSAWFNGYVLISGRGGELNDSYKAL